MTAYLIDTDGSKKEVTPKNGTNFELEEIYEMLDCDYVQVVSTHDGHYMIIDEDGKGKNKSVNQRATRLYLKGAFDFIVGKALVCHPKMFR